MHQGVNDMGKCLGRSQSGRNRVAGFVMVELMLVVSIIGILAAVALPSYQDYTTRARIVEALDLGEAAQKSVNEFYARWGVMPASNAEAGLPEAQRLRGRFVDGIEVQSSGALLISMNASTVSGKAAHNAVPNKVPYHLVLRPAVQSADPVAPVAWVCQLGEVPAGMQTVDLPGAASNLMDRRYLPAACRKA